MLKQAKETEKKELGTGQIGKAEEELDETEREAMTRRNQRYGFPPLSLLIAALLSLLKRGLGG